MSLPAAGNLTWDGRNALKFDAENQMNPVTGYIYSYDGEDHRVEKNYKGSITYYWYDDNFNLISTTGALVRDYAYLNGRKLAFLGIASGAQHYTENTNLPMVLNPGDSSGAMLDVAKRADCTQESGS